MGLSERKEREREKRRIEIMQAAKRTFVKYGLHGATMDKIAGESELAKGTLYLYFKSKEDLMMALIAEDLEHLIKSIQNAVANDCSSSEKLLRGISTFYAFSKKDQFIYRVMTQLNVHELEKSRIHTSVALRFTCANEELMDIMTQIVQEGIDRSEFHIETSARRVVVQLILALKGTQVIIRNGMIPSDWLGSDPETVFHESAALLVRGLTNPLSPKMSCCPSSQFKSQSTVRSKKKKHKETENQDVI